MKFPAPGILTTIVLVLACAGIATANTGTTGEAETSTTGADGSENRERLYQGYLLSTPQIQDPLKPLAHATAAIGRMEIHSAVVTVADPLETHLARMFDIQLSSLIRAYHARSYILDGFAFTWEPHRGSGPDKHLPTQGTNDYKEHHRDMPSVLVFRKDLWRKGENTLIEARYVVIFLVGESPTFGVQPEAFKRAAKCALALNGANPTGHEPLITDCSNPANEHISKGIDLDLDIIGPTFSGSMQSLALTLGELIKTEHLNKFKVEVTSPSATVKSNEQTSDWTSKLASEAGNEVSPESIKYKSLAFTLEQQLRALCNKIKRVKDNDKNIVILAEESTFGRGVYDILYGWSDVDKNKPGHECTPNPSDSTPPDSSVSTIMEDCKCSERIRVTQFPQNISAVRAERSRQDQTPSDVLKSLTQSKGQLLELNLSTIDEAADRPPPYDRLLSSRSDELMLYGTFDALNIWVNPSVVAIVATDVRDRLFLLNEVRKNLPMALPVLLEMDFLIAHPDYRKISRGSVVIPSGETVVKLDVYTGCGVTFEHPPHQSSYYSFPSDYSANIFKAALNFINHFDPRICSKIPGGLEINENATDPEPLVTTLAGFQQQDGSRPTMLAADSRINLERPVYILILAIGLLFSLVANWLLERKQPELIMMWPFSRLNPKRFMIDEDEHVDGPAEKPAQSPKIRWAPWMLMTVSVCLLLIATARSWLILVREPGELMWDLAHGRDVWVLICIFLIYAAIAIVGFRRLQLWRDRYNSYLGTGCKKNWNLYDDKCRGGQGASKVELYIWLGISITLGVAVLMGVFAIPTSVDDLLVPTIMSFLLLPIGTWFLVQFWQQCRNWTHFAMILGQTMDFVSKKLTGQHFTRDEGWPSPLATSDRPQSPFNLKVRSQDLDVLRESPLNVNWAKNTRQLIIGREWPFGEGKTRAFERWQAQLVAEMRFAAVTVRTCAWCAILAPTFVLMGMDVYPAPWERLQTIISISLIVVTFMAIMFAVLGLERHPLLARLFTLHGASLTLGGAFGALWPKLTAAVVILIPVLFPDVMDWLYSLLRSINSLN